MLYNVVLFSAVQQSESAVCKHIYSLVELPPTSHPIPPLQVITEHRTELPVLYSRFPLDTCFTYGTVHMSVLISQPSLLHCVHMSLLYVCISISALQIGSSVPSFQIPHICFIYFLLFFLCYFLNYEIVITHLQKTWKMQNKVTYSSTTWKSLSRVRLFANPWAIRSREFSRPEYWSG